MSKLMTSFQKAILASGLQDGMTISFHHHLRNGDRVLNTVLDVLEEMGYHDLTINASSLHRVHAPIIEHIKSGLITKIYTDYIDGAIGKYLTENPMAKPVTFLTHGGRAGDIANGVYKIDVAFIAASISDNMGNCSGKYGKSAFGSLGYGLIDARYAEKVIVITDELVEYPFPKFSIPETQVDYVVEMDNIGNPVEIATGIMQLTRNPVYLKIAQQTAAVIEASGLLKDGFSFQTGGSGIALSVARYVKEAMLKNNIKGSYGVGGITGMMVDLLESGCMKALMDVQDFDEKAVRSLRENQNHAEIDAQQYAYIPAKSCVISALDAVVLGATEVDLAFNVNVHTNSFGQIMGGSGGHSNSAAGARLSIITVPLTRGRIPVVVEHVDCVSTPGETIDAIVTQYGIAVNPAQTELHNRLVDFGLPVCDITELYKKAEFFTGKPKKVKKTEQVAAVVKYGDNMLIDTIYKPVG